MTCVPITDAKKQPPLRRKRRGTLQLVVTTLGTLLVIAAPASATPVTVSFGGDIGAGVATVGHGAIRVSPDTFGEPFYDSAPLILPFVSPNAGAARHTGNHPFNVSAGSNVLDFSFGKLDGRGAFDITSAPGSTVFGPNFVGTPMDPGDLLPFAGHTGTLPGALSLPNGTTLPSGTVIYSDSSGLVMDFDDPASYWYDSAIEHRTYTGGSWGFFYEVTTNTFELLAAYTDVTVELDIDFAGGTTTTTWTGTPDPVAGVLLPATGTATSPSIGALDGILTNETTSPFVGAFAHFPAELAITFDTDNAAVVAEPGSLGLLAFAGTYLGVLGHRRRKRHQRQNCDR